MQSPAIENHGHAVLGVTEALVALSGLGGGGQVSAAEASGAPGGATGDAVDARSLLIRLLEELPDVFVGKVLPRLDVASQVMLARTSKASKAALVSARLALVGKSRQSPLKLGDYGASVELLAWSAANGCPWIPMRSIPLWIAAMAKFDGTREGGPALLNAEWGRNGCTTLWCAAQRCVADPCYGDGMDGLHLAALLVQKCYTLGSDVLDVNAVGGSCKEEETTPLFVAVTGVSNGKFKIATLLAKLLINEGADVNTLSKLVFVGRGSSGEYKTSWTAPLWLAARAVYDGKEGGYTLASLLVKNGADVNAVGEDGCGCQGTLLQGTPLWLAARAVYDGKTNGLRLAKLLVGSSVSRANGLWDADLDIIGTDENDYESTPVWWAARAVCEGRGCGKEDGQQLLTLLVQKGANTNNFAKYEDHGVYTGFDRWDVQNSQLDISSWSTLLWFAARAVYDGKAGGLELAKLLVENGADLNAVGRTECEDYEGSPLWLAARAVCHGTAEAASALELAKFLVEKGADLEIIGIEGKRSVMEYRSGGNYSEPAQESTPVWWAARAVCEGGPGQEAQDGQELLLLLIRRGANVMRSITELKQT